MSVCSFFNNLGVGPRGGEFYTEMYAEYPSAYMSLFRQVLPVKKPDPICQTHTQTHTGLRGFVHGMEEGGVDAFGERAAISR